MKPDHSDVVFVFNKHDPTKFETFIERKSESGINIGFILSDRSGEYYFDENGGWMDYNGCYYDQEGQPAGWINLSEDNYTYTRFDIDYNFVENNENKYYTQDISKFDPFKDVAQKQYYSQVQLNKKESNHRQRQDPDLKSTQTDKDKFKGDHNKDRNQKQDEKKRGQKDPWNFKRSDYKRVGEKNDKNQEQEEKQNKKGKNKEKDNSKQNNDQSQYKRVEPKETTDSKNDQSQYKREEPKEAADSKEKEKQSDNQNYQKNQGDKGGPYVPKQQEQSEDSSELEKLTKDYTKKKYDNKIDDREDRRNNRNDKSKYVPLERNQKRQDREYDDQKQRNDRKRNNNRRGGDDDDQKTNQVFLLDITQMDSSIKEDQLKTFLIEKSGVASKDIQKLDLLQKDGLVGRLYVASSIAAYKIQHVSKQKLGDQEILIQY